MPFMNIKENDPQKETIEYILNTLLSCSDAKYINEIFVKDGSFRQGFFANWVGFMIELDTEFVNESLYETIDRLEDELADRATSFVISTEPDTIDRSHGIILYKKEN